MILVCFYTNFTPFNIWYQLEALHTEHLWKHFSKTNPDFNNRCNNETTWCFITDMCYEKSQNLAGDLQHWYFSSYGFICQSALRKNNFRGKILLVGFKRQGLYLRLQREIILGHVWYNLLYWNCLGKGQRWIERHWSECEVKARIYCHVGLLQVQGAPLCAKTFSLTRTGHANENWRR